MQSISKHPQSSYSVAEAPHNKVKNRFANIFPCKPYSYTSILLYEVVIVHLKLDDSLRVKLKEITGEEGSDYINASHLDVKKMLVSSTYYNLSPPSFRVTTNAKPILVLKVSTKTFSVILCLILNLGPMPNTVGDFWRMIWEKKLPTVVMLTRCFEGRVGHCVLIQERY